MARNRRRQNSEASGDTHGGPQTLILSNRFAILDTQACAMHQGMVHDIDSGSPFINLPLEIRQEICRDALGPGIRTHFTGNLNLICGILVKDAYNLFFPCKQMRDVMAALIYEKVTLSHQKVYTPEYQGRTPIQWLRSIGRNVRHIRVIEIEFLTLSYYPKTPFRQHERQHAFPIIEVFALLEAKAIRLEEIKIIVSRPMPPHESREQISGFPTGAQQQELRREFFPEVFFALKYLKNFQRIHKIKLSDGRYPNDPYGCGPYKESLFDGLLPTYLSKQLGFKMDYDLVPDYKRGTDRGHSYWLFNDRLLKESGISRSDLMPYDGTDKEDDEF